MAWVARLRVAVVRCAGDLGGVEGHWYKPVSIPVSAMRIAVAGECRCQTRHQRRAPPRPVLAGVEADVCLFVFGVAAIRLSEQRSRHIRRLVVAVQRRRHVGTDFGTGLTRCYTDGSTVAVEVCAKATACSAACRDGGSDLPRFSARRRIPTQALPLKKNLGGIEPLSRT